MLDCVRDLSGLIRCSFHRGAHLVSSRQLGNHIVDNLALLSGFLALGLEVLETGNDQR